MRNPMTLYRRKGSKIYQYDFWKNGVRRQGSTGVKNKRDAQDIENTLKTDIAKAKFGLAPAKQSPPLAEFLEGAFLQHVDKHAKTRSTAKAYAGRVKRLLKWPKWRDMPLSEITGDVINGFIGFRSSKKLPAVADRARTNRETIAMMEAPVAANAKRISISALNAELATLRKALNLAEEWGLCPRIKVRLLPGAKGRDFVVSPELEAEYLEAASYPLKQVAVIMLDLGLRPEECVSLSKSDISRDGVTVQWGKSANARRILPMTQRAKADIQLLCALFPDSPFLFPGRNGKHYTRGALDNAHNAFRKAHDWPEEFKLHAMRHTFATRLAESGANPFEIMKLMGHTDVRVSSRYIHPEGDTIRRAMARKEELDRIRRGEVTPMVLTKTAGN